MNKTKLAYIILPFWLSAVALGFNEIYEYMNKPGLQGTPPLSYPSNVENLKKTNLPQLLVFAHPKCPCSSSSIAELSRLLTKLDGKVETHIIFHHPENMTLNWVKSNLWEKAKQLKGAQVHIDTSNDLVNTFKPKTSGQVYLYDNNNKEALVYSGGITSSRGHEGDNTGSDSIASWVLYQKKLVNTFAIFGCSLFQKSSYKSEKVL